MRWWPTACKKGDMIRVRMGAICHYGIFVSESEVIQFGPTPASPQYRANGDLRVIATDINAFACGAIVEVAAPETAEERRRFSAGKTIKLARARLGQGGYDLIHNNCEHFVYECVYGVRRSTQAEEVRRRWYSRPLLNVYILPLTPDMALTPVWPPERQKEIDASRDGRKLEKFAAWKALEAGLAHAFGKQLSDLTFRKTPEGKWVCSEYGISLSHTEGFAVAAVSNAPVGVDIESIAASDRRFAAHPLARFCEKVFTPDELAQYGSCSPEDFLRLWTRKESIFKCGGVGSFSPQKIHSNTPNTESRLLPLDPPLMLSVSGEQVGSLCCYLLGGERPCRLEMKK